MNIDNEVVDTEIVSETPSAVLLPQDVLEGSPAEPIQLSREQIAAYLEHMQKKHNSQCRKKGFKGHFHQPAGSKIARGLAKNESVYGPVSLVSQSFRDMRAQAWKDSGKATAYHERGRVIAAGKAERKAAKEAAKKVANKSAVVA